MVLLLSLPFGRLATSRILRCSPLSSTVVGIFRAAEGRREDFIDRRILVIILIVGIQNRARYLEQGHHMADIFTPDLDVGYGILFEVNGPEFCNQIKTARELAVRVLAFLDCASCRQSLSLTERCPQ